MEVDADQARRGALRLPEVAAGIDRNAGGHRAEQKQEESRQRVQSCVKRQVRQPQRQHQRGDGFEDRKQRDGAQAEPDDGAGRV